MNTAPQVYAREHRLAAVDLFCGCGGVTEGLKQAGFNVVAAVDNDPVSGRTYRRNHPEVHLYSKDIRQVDPSALLNQDLADQSCDLLVTCAPCQPFSSQNQNGPDTERATLILETVRFARILKPSVILVENVPGLAAPKNAAILNLLVDGLTELGFSCQGPTQVDAADYGVPQRRRRLIMIATARGVLTGVPEPNTPEGKRLTVREAIGDLPQLASGQTAEGDSLHFARRHSQLAIKRLKAIPKDGGSRSALPDSLQLECHKRHDGHPDVYGRMAWNDIAPTLTTGCTDITRGRFAHPRDNRAITLREAARLQTFRDTYIFEGNSGQIARQIGNAVPVQLARSLGETICRSLGGHHCGTEIHKGTASCDKPSGRKPPDNCMRRER